MKTAVLHTSAEYSSSQFREKNLRIQKIPIWGTGTGNNKMFTIILFSLHDLNDWLLFTGTIINWLTVA
jgi:hypothetical protein